jgi:FKBP12-rapamycin complex-associated protein
LTCKSQIIPVFASVTRRSPARYQDFHLQQLTILVGIIRQHVRNFMPDVVGLITDLWSNVNLHLPLVSLVDALGRALEAEFKPFLPEVLPLLLKLFDGETMDSKSEKKVQAQIKVFDAFYTFGTSIEEYLHLIIPIIVRTYERVDAQPALRKRGIQSIDGLSRKVNFSDHASRIIHPLVRVLRNSSNELRLAALDCLCSLVIQLGSDFAIFVPTIQKVLVLRESKTSVVNESTDPAQHPAVACTLRELHHEASQRRTPPARARASGRIVSNIECSSPP